MTDLSELIEELKSSSEAPRWLSDKVLRALGWYMVCNPDEPEAYWKAPNGDACPDGYQPHVAANVQDAVDYVVPEGWMYEVHRVPTDEGVNYSALVNWQPAGRSHANNAALALCIAALKAREA